MKITSFCKAYINKVFFDLLKYLRGNCSNIDPGNQFFSKFYTNSNIKKKIMIISIYLGNLCRSWKIITNTKSFFYILLSFEGSIWSLNNYNISLELLNKNTSFGKNKFKFRNNSKKCLFLFITRICGDCLCLVEIYYELN